MRNNLKDTIKTNIHEENEAIADYTKAASSARKQGNTQATKLFSHIASEEKHHKQELKRMLKKVK